MMSFDLKIVLLMVLINFALSAVVTQNRAVSAAKSANESKAIKSPNPIGDQVLIQRSKKTYPKPHPILDSRLMKATASKQMGQKSLFAPRQDQLDSVINGKGQNAKTKKVVRTIVSVRGAQALSGARGHRAHRYKRYSPSGVSPAVRPQQQELLELLQLLNGNRNDLDPLGNYLLAARGGNSGRETDAVDSQSDLLSQVLRNSLPADLFDQAGSAFSEPEVDPEFISEGGEGNELPNAYNVYNLRQQPPPQQEDMISPTHGQQVSFDSARIHHPSSIWGRMDGDGDDVVRDDLPEKESDLNVNRLARLYEALLNANRN